MTASLDCFTDHNTDEPLTLFRTRGVNAQFYTQRQGNVLGQDIFFSNPFWTRYPAMIQFGACMFPLPLMLALMILSPSALMVSPATLALVPVTQAQSWGQAVLSGNIQWASFPTMIIYLANMLVDTPGRSLIIAQMFFVGLMMPLTAWVLRDRMPIIPAVVLTMIVGAKMVDPQQSEMMLGSIALGLLMVNQWTTGIQMNSKNWWLPCVLLIFMVIAGVSLFTLASTIMVMLGAIALRFGISGAGIFVLLTILWALTGNSGIEYAQLNLSSSFRFAINTMIEPGQKDSWSMAIGLFVVGILVTFLQRKNKRADHFARTLIVSLTFGFAGMADAILLIFSIFILVFGTVIVEVKSKSSNRTASSSTTIVHSIAATMILSLALMSVFDPASRLWDQYRLSQMELSSEDPYRVDIITDMGFVIASKMERMRGKEQDTPAWARSSIDIAQWKQDIEIVLGTPYNPNVIPTAKATPLSANIAIIAAADLACVFFENRPCMADGLAASKMADVVIVPYQSIDPVTDDMVRRSEAFLYMNFQRIIETDSMAVWRRRISRPMGDIENL